MRLPPKTRARSPPCLSRHSLPPERPCLARFSAPPPPPNPPPSTPPSASSSSFLQAPFSRRRLAWNPAQIRCPLPPEVEVGPESRPRPPFGGHGPKVGSRRRREVPRPSSLLPPPQIRPHRTTPRSPAAPGARPTTRPPRLRLVQQPPAPQACFPSWSKLRLKFKVEWN